MPHRIYHKLSTHFNPSRLKKIKCLLPSPETKCEACKAAKIPCRFRDRERYFAERSRAIAGPNSGLYATELRCALLEMYHFLVITLFSVRSEPGLTHDALSAVSGSSSHSMSPYSHPRSNSHSPRANGMVSADIDSARYPSYPSEHRHISGSSHKYVFFQNCRQLSRQIVSRHHSSMSSFDSSRSNNGLNYYAGHSSSQLHYPSSRPNSYQPDQRSVQLFDPENPQRPNPSLMTHYINVFFEQHGSEFPFLSYQDISTDFWDQRLSSILANCIAAMASQYVTRKLFK